MIRAASPQQVTLVVRRSRDTHTLSRDEPPSPYGVAFWLTYAANSALMIAISLLFRFADFVNVLGGSELELGFIVGVGTVGSLSMRLAQGVGVDRYGARRIWLASLAIFIVAVAAHALVSSAHGPAIYILQIVYRTAVAGAYGAAITFVSLSVNPSRMAESIGLLGTAGFVGMVIGPLLGDWLLGSHPNDRAALNSMFYVAAGLGGVSLVTASFATHGESPPAARRRRPPLWAVLRRYHPGIMLLMGVTTGVAIGLPNTFVRPFTAGLGIERIAAFFTGYAIAAFTTRIATRRLYNRWGIRPTMLLGMTCLVTGMLAFVVVGQAWHLIAPAVLLGAAHALLFPAVLAGGSTAFPDRYRGLGTAMMLATLDLGLLVGAPLAGGIVRIADHFGLPGYTIMFASMAVISAAATLWYAVSSAGHDSRDSWGSVVRRPRFRAPRNPTG